MATKNSINSNIPIEISKGGTANTSFTSNAPMYYDGSKLTSVSGAATTVLTSQGAAMAPIFVNLPTFFTIVAGDPVSPAPGDTWYNSVSNLFRGCVNSGGAGVWVIKANYPVAGNTIGLAGTSGASVLGFGGATTPFTLSTNLYDGIANTWTDQSAPISTFGNVGASGTPSDALAIGEGQVKICQRYSAGTWTSKANLNHDGGASGSSGTASDALKCGGAIAGGVTNYVERYNGGSNVWSTTTSMNTNRFWPTLSGYSGGSDNLAAGGGNPGSGGLATCERFNGTTWTVKANFTTGREQGAASGANGGAAMIFAGQNLSTGFTNVTEIYDGVGNSWSTSGPMNVSRYTPGGCGSSSDALCTGGSTFSGPSINSNERFNGSSNTNVTFTLT